MATETLPTFYENRLDRDPEWAMNEGSRFFEGKSQVQDTLRRIVRRLRDLEIPYAIVGGMALFKHGYRRYSEDVEILVSRDDLDRIDTEAGILCGAGVSPAAFQAGGTPAPQKKIRRDTESGVRVEFLIAGEFPGDGKPKPVAFPDPATVSIEIGGVSYLSIPALIELKLASGMTNIGRLKDLADVQEFIKALKLPEDLAESLNPYVRDKYRELWIGSHQDFGADS